MDFQKRLTELDSKLIECRYDRKVLTGELKQARGILQAILESPNTSSLMRDVIQNFLKGVQIND